MHEYYFVSNRTEYECIQTFYFVLDPRENISVTSYSAQPDKNRNPYLCVRNILYVSVNLSTQAIYKLSENFRQFVKFLFQSVKLKIV